jgi:DNA-binding GntR family transcriptional regulator
VPGNIGTTKHRRRPTQKAEYLAERAYRDLRQRIIAGEFAPGDHLKENALVALLRVSRSVVRQALIRLTAEGLLLDSPKRGKTLAVFTEEKLAKLVPIRVCLEQLAIREAVPKLTDTEAQELKCIAEKLKNPGLDPAEHESLDMEFHRKIWKVAGNDELLKVLTEVVGPFHVVGNAVVLSPFYRRSASVISLQQVLLERERDAGGHQLLAEAICRRDVEASCRLMAEHITVNYAIEPEEFGQRVGKLISRYWHPPATS